MQKLPAEKSTSVSHEAMYHLALMPRQAPFGLDALQQLYQTVNTPWLVLKGEPAGTYL